MGVQSLVRGSVAWDRLEAVARAVLDRTDREVGHVRFIEADNWLSTPFVVDGEFFVKVISRRNSVVHAVLTTGRNLGAVTAGTEGFFEHVASPYEMARRELEATRRMRAAGVDAPEPLDVFEVDGLGVLVSEYLDGFEPLDAVGPDRAERLAPGLFTELARVHDAGLAHGDLRAENVLVVDDDLYFIDATSLQEPSETTHADALTATRQYDLACALAALEPLVGAGVAVDAALVSYPATDLLGAREYLGFVDVRPDHDFDGPALRGEIDHRADGEAG